MAHIKKILNKKIPPKKNMNVFFMHLVYAYIKL